MTTKSLISEFRKLAKRSKKEGYIEDTVEYLFRVEVIELLKENIRQFKNLEKQIKYMWQTLDELKEKENESIKRNNYS